MKNKTQLKITKEFNGKYTGGSRTSPIPIEFNNPDFNDSLALNVLDLFNIDYKRLFTKDQDLTITISIETDAYQE